MANGHQLRFFLNRKKHDFIPRQHRFCRPPGQERKRRGEEEEDAETSC